MACLPDLIRRALDQPLESYDRLDQAQGSPLVTVQAGRERGSGGAT